MHYVVGPLLGAYARRILLDFGIAIILAVSLNIVNGFTGQFSIGHAGFMAVGGYAAAVVTYYGSLLDAPRAGEPTDPADVHRSDRSTLRRAADGCLGRSPALAGGARRGGASRGWLVGLPSLRLRGDYLAIVTLGFGEIVRVLLQQTDTQLVYAAGRSQRRAGDSSSPPPLGGAHGFTDMPKVTNLFWIYLFVGLTVLVAYRLKTSQLRPRAARDPRERDRGRGDGREHDALKVGAFVLAAFFAGIAGALYAHQLGNTLRPDDAGFLRVVRHRHHGRARRPGLDHAASCSRRSCSRCCRELLRPTSPQYRMIVYALALIVADDPAGRRACSASARSGTSPGRIWRSCCRRRDDAQGVGGVSSV